MLAVLDVEKTRKDAKTSLSRTANAASAAVEIREILSLLRGHHDPRVEGEVSCSGAPPLINMSSISLSHPSRWLCRFGLNLLNDCARRAFC